MLYNPNWKTDPLTLDALIAWLEKQPANRRYDFFDECGECLIGQYMAHLGIAWSMREYKSVICRIFDGYSRSHRVLVESPHTFGAALSRAVREHA